MASRVSPGVAAVRGVRNNNPGNIEKGAPWQGLSADQSSDPRFAVFEGPEWGIRAIARVLITYQDKRRAPDGSKIDTAEEIINRWAPPIENDSSSYAHHVRMQMGMAVGETINVHDYVTMRALVEAIIRHENGSQPYSDEVIKQGLILAGVKPAVKPLAKSRTVSGAGVAGVAAVTAPVVPQIVEALDTAQQVAPVIQTLLAYSPWVLAVIGLAAAGYVIYRRVQDQKVRFS